ncbi:transposase, partial [BEV proteobacterium]|nr:transposase [Candidatus Symbiopectobacterium sp. Chty_BC]
TKTGRKESAPALLAGLSILLNTLTLLADYTPEEIAHLAWVIFHPS